MQTSNPPCDVARITTSTTTVLKTGKGVLERISVHHDGATGNSITVYDNTAGSGTVIWGGSAALSATTPHTHDVNARFENGLTVVTAGTTPPQVFVYYK